MQFHVPQFIEVEDKIFGPFSAKQFMYIGGAAGMFFVVFSITGSFLVALIISSPVIVLGVALAFYKINNRPFVHVVEAAVKYFTNTNLYIWKKVEKKPVPKNEGELSLEPEPDMFVPKLSDSKLKDIAWSLDIQESGKAHHDESKLHLEQ